MNDRMAFVGIYLLIVAAGGFVTGVEMAWILAAVTAGLAAIAEELLYAAGRYAEREALLVNASLLVALLSWATGIAAGFALLIG